MQMVLIFNLKLALLEAGLEMSLGIDWPEILIIIPLKIWSELLLTQW